MTKEEDEVINKRIRNLRKEIRHDMQDYKLSYATKPDDDAYDFLFKDKLDVLFSGYLRKRITNNLLRLKELVEDKNE